MTALASAVVLVGVLCVLDLLLTIGVTRKLREYGPPGPARAPGGGMTPLRSGEELPAFTAVAVPGEPVPPGSVPLFAEGREGLVPGLPGAPRRQRRRRR